MNYIIDKEKRPVYLQLYNQIRDDIVNEILHFNSKLPSIRGLAEETGVSTVTVAHAYELLCDEGYVEPRERSGFVVCFRKKDGFAASASLSRKYHSAYHTDHSYPDFSLSVLSKTMRKVITEHGDLLLEKSPNLGCTELREAIKNYLRRNRGIYGRRRADSYRLRLGILVWAYCGASRQKPHICHRVALVQKDRAGL